VAIEIRVHKKFSARVNRARLKRVVQRALNAEKKLKPSESRSRLSLTIYVATDSEIRLLNRKFHATDAATDVLSFPSHAGAVGAILAVAQGDGTPGLQRTQGSASEHRPYLGDIIISYDRARVQARQAQWRIADELDLLAVHGALHLLGYDDTTPRKRATMWKKQEKILGKVKG